MTLTDTEETLLICGEQDSNLKKIEKRFGVQIFARSSTLAIRGNPHRVDLAITLLEDIQNQIRLNRKNGRHGEPLPEFFIDAALSPASANPKVDVQDAVYKSPLGKIVRALSPNQKTYIDAIAKSDLVLADGPAGTGKTFLAVVSALKELHAGNVGRIVLTRPVVEAGEKLGFLPGDFYEKVNPYLKPLYDAFYALVGQERFRLYRDDETIEIVPLAYMRGRTLENAFVILDEAQNTTPEQMKMFLTRMGQRSKMVINGDVTQIDLQFKNKSGFTHALKVLKDISDIQFVRFAEEDVVRHALVRRILRAYVSESEKEPSQ